MEEKKCQGNCMMCSMPQQVYCASQMTYNLSNVVAAFGDRMTAMEDAVRKIEERIGGNVTPTKHKKGSGVVTIDSQDKLIETNE